MNSKALKEFRTASFGLISTIFWLMAVLAQGEKQQNYLLMAIYLIMLTIYFKLREDK